MTETVKDLLLDVGKSVIGVSVSRAFDLQSRLNFGDSFVLSNVSNGAIYYLIGDTINYITGDAVSNLASGNIVGGIDGVLYYSAVSAGAELTKIDGTLYKFAGNAGLSRSNAEVLSESVIVSAGRITARMIDEVPNVPDWLKVIRHPSRLATMAN